jgi:hypothetical protein
MTPCMRKVVATIRDLGVVWNSRSKPFAKELDEFKSEKDYWGKYGDADVRVCVIQWHNNLWRDASQYAAVICVYPPDKRANLIFRAEATAKSSSSEAHIEVLWET